MSNDGENLGNLGQQRFLLLLKSGRRIGIDALLRGDACEDLCQLRHQSILDELELVGQMASQEAFYSLQDTQLSRGVSGRFEIL
jgi:hypothetical protein